MIEAPGVIDEVGNDAVWVRLTAQETGCGRCHEPGGCGGMGIAHAFGKPNDRFRITDVHGYSVGEHVQLVADERAALYAGLTSYGLPTLGALLGAGLGTRIDDEVGALVGLVAGLVGAVFLAKRFLRSRAWADRLQVTIRHAPNRCGHSDVQ